MKRYLILFFLSLAMIIYSKEVSIKTIDKDLDIPLEGVKIINQGIRQNLFYR